MGEGWRWTLGEGQAPTTQWDIGAGHPRRCLLAAGPRPLLMCPLAAAAVPSCLLPSCLLPAPPHWRHPAHPLLLWCRPQLPWCAPRTCCHWCGGGNCGSGGITTHISMRAGMVVPSGGEPQSKPCQDAAGCPTDAATHPPPQHELHLLPLLLVRGQGQQRSQRSTLPALLALKPLPLPLPLPPPPPPTMVGPALPRSGSVAPPVADTPAAPLAAGSPLPAPRPAAAAHTSFHAPM